VRLGSRVSGAERGGRGVQGKIPMARLGDQTSTFGWALELRNQPWVGSDLRCERCGRVGWVECRMVWYVMVTLVIMLHEN
jgi:hypothetical protein